MEKIARIGKRMNAMHGELLSALGFLEDNAIRGHRNDRDSSREAVGQLWSRMDSVFQKEAMRVQVQSVQAVYKAVRDVRTHNQGIQGKYS